jgi:transposase-like protein
VTVLLVFVGLLLAAIVSLLGAESELDRPTRCPRCGLEQARPVYRGSFGEPSHRHCTSCGASFRRTDDGRIVFL